MLKYETKALTLLNTLGYIEKFKVKDSDFNVDCKDRISTACDLLNLALNSELLMPDIFIDPNNETISMSKSIGSIILLNISGELNNIFFNFEEQSFFALPKGLGIPVNSMTLSDTLINKNWFKIKYSMQCNGYSGGELDEMFEKSSDLITNLLDMTVVVRKNISMESKDFFELSH